MTWADGLRPSRRRSPVGTSVSRRNVVFAVGASIGGLLVHNLEEFGPSILLWPETWVPAAITVLLGVAMCRLPGTGGYPDTGVFVATMGWAAVVIVVGGASVLPLSIWPFTPEQTVSHYTAHVVYALAQLPLLWVGWRGFRFTRRSN